MKPNSMKPISTIIILVFITVGSIYAQKKDSLEWKVIFPKDIKVGAERTELYFPLLKNKRVAVVANQTSMIGNTQLVDSLLNAGIKVEKILCPEHGFRGIADAGENVKSNTDSKTGLPIISLYGNNKKPNPTDLKDIDIVVFDIQDVGVRFYTYISTMHYVMEACAENNVQFIVLDRPNPNGFYVDGPVMKKELTSFVGMHLVPLVHGMTIAEYAQMINEEGWLKGGIRCKLSIIPLEGYKHTYFYQLPIKPSPNLPNMKSVYLYPSIGLFESTIISVGRGTDKPFQIYGHPDLHNYTFSYVPKSKTGAKQPFYEGKTCYGIDLSIIPDSVIQSFHLISLFYLKDAYKNYPQKELFFNAFFEKLSGSHTLKQQIIDNKDENEIHQSWQNDLIQFKKIRKKYLLYPDFE